MLLDSGTLIDDISIQTYTNSLYTFFPLTQISFALIFKEPLALAWPPLSFALSWTSFPLALAASLEVSLARQAWPLALPFSLSLPPLIEANAE